MELTVPDLLTTVPVLAAIGAAVLVLIVAGAVVLRRRRTRARRRAEPASVPEYRLQPVGRDLAETLHARWTTMQIDFVDAPHDTLHRADALVAEAMRARGYPASDAAGRTDLLARHEPAHASRYQNLRDALDRDKVSTEDCRQVLVQTRTLFDALLRDGAESQPRLFAA